jgi:hypothetical protein
MNYNEFQEQWRNMTDQEKSECAALADVICHVDRRQAALERLADEDPMGFVFSGSPHDGRKTEQADRWIDERLGATRPQR